MSERAMYRTRRVPEEDAESDLCLDVLRLEKQLALLRAEEQLREQRDAQFLADVMCVASKKRRLGKPNYAIIYEEKLMRMAPHQVIAFIMRYQDPDAPDIHYNADIENSRISYRRPTYLLNITWPTSSSSSSKTATPASTRQRGRRCKLNDIDIVPSSSSSEADEEKQ